jgi:hypothetical protein
MPKSRFDFDFNLLHDVLYQDKDYEIAYLSNRSIVKPGDRRRGAGRDRGPPLDGDGGAPALVEVTDGEDTVFVASLGEGVLDFLEEFRRPGRRDRGDRSGKKITVPGLEAKSG